MKKPSSLFAAFALLQCLLGIHGLEITFDGFENLDCGKPETKCRGPNELFNITGRIILEEGELMPAYISYEYKCPGSDLCYTYNGEGEIWARVLYIDARKCDYETFFYGCKLISGKTYRHFVVEGMYYFFRLCIVRARMMDQKVNERLTPINAPGIKHVSNELKLSDYKNHSSYSLEQEAEIHKINSEDPSCVSTGTSKNGVDKIYLPDAVLIILGSLIAVNVIIIF